MQFYATIYFERGSDSGFAWRSGGKNLKGSMSDLATITGYMFYPEPHPEFARVVQHHRSKNALAFAYQETISQSYIGTIWVMTPKYDVLRHIFWTSLAPKAGPSDEIWGTTIDLLVYAHEETEVDIMDFMYEEMKACV